MRKKPDRRSGSSRRAHPSAGRFRRCEDRCGEIKTYLDYSVRRKI